MPIIVKHLPSGNEYLLIGLSGGTDRTFPPTRLLRNWIPEGDGEDNLKIGVCDRNGQIFWLPAAEVAVTAVDGKKPSEILPEIITTVPEVTPVVGGDGDEGEEFGEDEDEDWI